MPGVVWYNFNKSGEWLCADKHRQTRKPVLVGAPDGARRTLPVRLKPHLPRIFEIILFSKGHARMGHNEAWKLPHPFLRGIKGRDIFI